MKKGGYKIIDFKGTALSGTAVELPGIYAQIVDDYDKPVMISGVSLNGDIMDDAYAGVQEKVAGDLSKSVELTVYGGIITVTEDDEVSFVLSKTTAELTAEIGDLDDLDTTDKDSVVDAINEVNGYATNKLLVEKITAAEAITLPAADIFTITIDVTKTGYVPLGIVGYSLGVRASVDITGIEIDDNIAYIIGRNNVAAATPITTTPYVKVLYRKA